MVKLNKIYTRTGDDGTTGLVDGSRVAKSSALIVAIGDVDEANCVIGVAIAAAPDGAHAAALGRIQNDLFDLGADLATPAGIEGALRIVPSQVAWLEEQIDAITATQAPLTSFILPGGAAQAAALHHSRAVVRRAERSAIAAAPVSPAALAYLNRLSDYLFVVARTANEATGDVLWRPGASR